MCAVEDCDRLAEALGWCPMHYMRYRRHGDPTRVVTTAGMSVADRFQHLVMVNENGGCWLWQGPLSDGGYGRLYVEKGVEVPAHRWSYEHSVGPIPDGLTIDHLCRVRACVNPDHLEPVTMRVNILRGTSPASHNATKTACKHGHPFDEENTYHMPAGGRSCRACQRNAAAAYRARRRAAS